MTAPTTTDTAAVTPPPIPGSEVAGGPVLPVVLGLGGLVPFWALAVARVIGWPHAIPPGEIDGMLAVYAATILSFLGGIRWGIAVATLGQAWVATDYLFGVTPQLFAWGALFLPDPWRYAVLALGMLALGPIDNNLVRRGLAPAWFGRLRMMLSLGAGAALLLTAFT